MTSKALCPSVEGVTVEGCSLRSCLREYGSDMFVDAVEVQRRRRDRRKRREGSAIYSRWRVHGRTEDSKRSANVCKRPPASAEFLTESEQSAGQIRSNQTTLPQGLKASILRDGLELRRKLFKFHSPRLPDDESGGSCGSF